MSPPAKLQGNLTAHPAHRSSFLPQIGLCLLATASLSRLWAQLPEPRLSVVSPQGGAQGTTFEFVVSGTDLEESSLRFSHQGISATPNPKDPKKFNLTVAKETPAGLYDVRVLGKNGVSNPRRFEVSGLSEQNAVQNATTREQAQQVVLPCVIRGTAQKQQVQWFCFEAKHGAEFFFDCHAAVLDSRMDPHLALFDSEGTLLVQSRNKPIQWTPSKDAKLWIALRDFINNGGPEHYYRLYAGQPDQLPKAAPDTPLVLWPPAASALPESEPNDPARPANITLPVEIRGEFYPERDADSFQFMAKKGEVWWMEVTSNRTGAPTNPRLVIEPMDKAATGSEETAQVLVLEDSPWFPGDPDFDGQHFDPIGRFEAKQDGVYKITLRDLNNNITSHNRHYHLSIRKPSPDFALTCAVLPPTPNKPFKTFSGPLITVRAANLHPGQVLPLRVMAVRRDGFEDAIRLTASNLPAGVSADPCLIGTKQNEGTLLLRASPEAQPWSGNFQVEGIALVNGQAVIRGGRMSSPLWESTVTEFVEPPRSRICSETVLAVVSAPAFPNSIRCEPSSLESTVGAKIKVTLQMEGQPADTPITSVKPFGIQDLDKAKGVEIPAMDGKAEYELDLASLKLSAGEFTIWFRGEQKVKRDLHGKPTDMTLSVCSNPLQINIKEAPKK
jgi:hypothetical protein